MRFTDLHRGILGISTNALFARLRDLVDTDVVHRRLLPPPAASTVYELTESGHELDEIVVQLLQWGASARSRASGVEAARRTSGSGCRQSG
jgi:DNA-binding HxlR family transcriptional regulator